MGVRCTELSTDEVREKVLLRDADRSRYLDWYANGLPRALGLAAGKIGFACWSIMMAYIYGQSMDRDALERLFAY